MFGQREWDLVILTSERSGSSLSEHWLVNFMLDRQMTPLLKLMMNTADSIVTGGCCV